ncbi:hypothetical protein GQ457_01G052010 [Hibiscus cannabinus]
MLVFFSLTTSVGIAVGKGIPNAFDVSSPAALIVEGMLEAVSVGILIYMAMVDLLAADFMNPNLQNNGILQTSTGVFSSYWLCFYVSSGSLGLNLVL